MEAGTSTPEPTKTTLVTTRLEQDVAAELARRAAKADRSVSAELRRAVRFYLAEDAAASAA